MHATEGDIGNKGVCVIFIGLQYHSFKKINISKEQHYDKKSSFLDLFIYLLIYLFIYSFILPLKLTYTNFYKPVNVNNNT